MTLRNWLRRPWLMQRRRLNESRKARASSLEPSTESPAPSRSSGQAITILTVMKQVRRLVLRLTTTELYTLFQTLPIFQSAERLLSHSRSKRNRYLEAQVIKAFVSHVAVKFTSLKKARTTSQLSVLIKLDVVVPSGQLLFLIVFEIWLFAFVGSV